jgi:sulfate/thiosulfate-binding protein
MHKFTLKARGRRLAPVAGAAAAAIALSAGLATSAAAAGGSINLVAYSTPAAAYTALASVYAKTTGGSGTTVAGSYGPSGQQARNVAAGQAADVVNFSLEPDMQTLVKAGIVSPSWDTVGPDHGMVTDSVVVFVVRQGNPKHLTTWSDLVKPGVQVITPNPFSSGSARWNLTAAYGAQLELGKSKAQAKAYLGKLLKNTVAQPSSASSALASFLAGTGDVVLDYEDDAIAAQNKGEPISYVIPKQTILIQNPIAVTKNAANPTAAKAFVQWLLSKQGQELWAKEGYRPVLPGAAQAAGVIFPTPKQLFTISYLGGWSKVSTQFFDPTSGLVTQIEQSLGQSTSSG